MLESESHSVMSDSLQPHGLYSQWNFPSQNTGVDSVSFFQGIFPTQGSNPGLLHCRQILYQLSCHSVQLSSVTQLCPTLCEPINCSITDLPIQHHLLYHAQTYVH